MFQPYTADRFFLCSCLVLHNYSPLGGFFCLFTKLSLSSSEPFTSTASSDEFFLHPNKKGKKRKKKSMKKPGRDEMQFNMYKNMLHIQNNLVTLGYFVCIWKWHRHMSRSCHKRQNSSVWYNVPGERQSDIPVSLEAISIVKEEILCLHIFQK